ncbi:MAG: EmrA/EmrK family multidrug efflux transporter periplasmic adaptor subunit, partial [Pseudomonadota bacterium]|nr:EmrA/EmrK family multidrug efflux transporter periplasmic adaptor subunit [Pseudomonadota bacterium]
VGLSMRVSVDTHNRSGKVLARTSTDQVLYHTPVYTGSTAGAAALIRRIILANDPAARAAGTLLH